MHGPRQGWRYLFHPDERLPPFAVVVALPLVDGVDEEGAPAGKP